MPQAPKGFTVSIYAADLSFPRFPAVAPNGDVFLSERLANKITLLRDTDQMSMAVALEVREPFLDYQLIEFVLGVNDEHKFPHTPKKLLTDSLGDLLPLVALAHRHNYLWLQDFLEDEVTITSDLYEILRAFRCHRPSA